MQKLITTKNLVKTILETDVRARNSDSYLYLKVIQHEALQRGIDLETFTVETFLLNMQEWGFTGFEGVRRTRQKVQNEHIHLKGNADTLTARKAREEVYREFSNAKGV